MLGSSPNPSPPSQPLMDKDTLEGRVVAERVRKGVRYQEPVRRPSHLSLATTCHLSPHLSPVTW